LTLIDVVAFSSAISGVTSFTGTVISFFFICTGSQSMAIRGSFHALIAILTIKPVTFFDVSFFSVRQFSPNLATFFEDLEKSGIFPE